MGRAPASFMRAESVFYWIRQEKRKRREAVAKLDAKAMYFYIEAKKGTCITQVEDSDLPPLPIQDVKNDELIKDFHSEYHGVTESILVKNEETHNYEDDELMHWYNNENNNHEDNFQTH